MHRPLFLCAPDGFDDGLEGKTLLRMVPTPKLEELGDQYTQQKKKNTHIANYKTASTNSTQKDPFTF